MRKTIPLHLLKFGLQRTAGSYNRRACLKGATSGHGKIHGRTATVPWSAKFTSAMKDVAITFW
jgi:hypothetical protein